MLWQLREAPGQQRLQGFRAIGPGDAVLPPSAIYREHAARGEEEAAEEAEEPQQQQRQQQQQAVAASPSARPISPGGSRYQQAAAPRVSPAGAGATSPAEAAELREAHQAAARMRAECDVLKGPPRSSKDDPAFMDTFYKASRLHFIGGCCSLAAKLAV